MTQRNKQARQTFHCFVLNSHFIQPSECKYVLFVCLSVSPQVSLFHCVSDTLARDFLSPQLIFRGKVELYHLLYDFRGKTIKTIFRGGCQRRKLKSMKNNLQVFQTKPKKIGDAKISNYTVCRLTCASAQSNQHLHYSLTRQNNTFFCYIWNSKILASNWVWVIPGRSAMKASFLMTLLKL